MLNTSQITLGSIVSFELYPSLIIAPGYTRAKVEDILSFSSAMLFEDVEAQHISVWPTLPSDVPKDPRSFYYLKLKLISGESKIIGIPWIKDNTYVVDSSRNIRFTIPNIDPADESIIRAQLGALNYKIVDVEYFD